MLVTKKKIQYKAFGLTIHSEISFSELIFIASTDNLCDIEIRIKDLTGQWATISNNENEFVIREQFVMFRAYDIAIFCIENGKTISVSPLKDYNEDMVRLWILGTCIGAILLQRRVIPLHGSAVLINGNAYAIIGDSGAGKSTLASAFIRNGFQLLTDDVIAVSLNGHDEPIVTPSYPQQKLWQDSLGNFGMRYNEYKSIHGREDKYYVPVVSNYYGDPVPLAGVIELVKTTKYGITIEETQNLTRFYTLYSNTFRNFMIQGLGLMEWHFNTCAKMINQIEVYKLQRSESGFNAQQLVDTILITLNKGEVK